jgi:polygalacturonase
VVIGSEISGNVRNVFAENCTMSSPNLDRALRIKSNSRRGGVAENIYMRNVTVGDLAEAVVHIDLFYAKEKGEYLPAVRNVEVKNVTSKNSPYAIYIKSDDAYPVENILVQDCVFEGVKKGNLLQGYKNLRFKNVTVNGEQQK